MSVITFPTALVAATAAVSWSQQRRDVVFTSTFGSQAQENSPPLWTAVVQGTNEDDALQYAGAWQALLMQLRGKTNQLALWNLARPVPNGTMRGTMTLNTAIVKGATSINILAATEAGKTLQAGDYIGFGSGLTQQVVMITALATADGSGIITASFEPAARNAIALGAAVAWNMPQALFRQTASKAGWNYVPGVIVSGMALDLLEDWRP
jgi:hypothetical protein